MGRWWLSLGGDRRRCHLDKLGVHFIGECLGAPGDTKRSAYGVDLVHRRFESLVDRKDHHGDAGLAEMIEHLRRACIGVADDKGGRQRQDPFGVESSLIAELGKRLRLGRIGGRGVGAHHVGAEVEGEHDLGEIAVEHHDLHLAAAYADRIVALNRGVVVGDGPPGDLITTARISDLYRHTVDIVSHPTQTWPATLGRRQPQTAATTTDAATDMDTAMERTSA